MESYSLPKRLRFFVVFSLVLCKVCSQRSPFDNAETDDFKTLILEGGAFVDKTMLIKDYLQYNELVLVTRPRGWGKSINLSMIKAFLELEVDDLGVPVLEVDRVNGVFFSGGVIPQTVDRGGQVKILNRLRIADSNVSMMLQGTYPVLFLDWNQTSATSYEQFENKLRQATSRLFQQFSYLSKYLVEAVDRNKFDICTSGTALLEQLTDCYRFLCEALCKRFHRRVQILFDNYDAPITKMLARLVRDKPTFQVAINSPEFDRVARTVVTILNVTLRQNPFLEQAMITGQFPMSRSNERHLALNQFNLLDDKTLFRHYGFSQCELDRLLHDYSRTFTRQSLREWFSGYQVAGQILYNPYCVITYLGSSGRPALDTVRQPDDRFQSIDDLLLSDRLQELVQEVVARHEISAVIDRRKRVFRELADQNLFPFLLFGGYLTPVSPITGAQKMRLKIPNEQIKAVYIANIDRWRKSRFPRLDEETIRTKMKLLADYRFDEFQLWLQETFAQIDLVRKREQFYSNCMFALALTLREYYEMYPQVRSGLGRADLVLLAKHTPRGGYRNALILEYKLASSVKTIKSKAEKALLQIIDRRYDSFFVKSQYYYYIESVAKIGLAFFDKYVNLQTRLDYLSPETTAPL